MEFAQSTLLWDEYDWYSVLWTDECYIWMGENRGTVNVTRTKDEKLHPDCLVPRFAKKNSFMIWGGILGSTGEKLLVIWEKKDWGSIRARTYIDHILQPVILPFLQRQSRPVIFMDDNAPAHTAQLTVKFKKDNLIHALNWPSGSPDLNPIENIWNILKNRLQAREPRPVQIEEIKKAVVEEWNAITVEEIRKCVDSMPDRIQAVVDNLGGHTRW